MNTRIMKNVFVLGILLWLFMGFSVVQGQGRSPYTASDIEYSPDGTLLAIGGGRLECNDDPTFADDYAIRILDAHSGELLRSLLGHTCSVSAIAWSPDGLRLMSTGQDNFSIIWDPVTGEQIASYARSGTMGTLTAAAWSPDAQRVMVTEGSMIAIWDPTSGRILQAYNIPLGGYFTASDWSPDGTRIAAANAGDVIRIWDAAPISAPAMISEPLLTFDEAGVHSIDWSPDNRSLALGVGSEVHIFDPDTGETLRTFQGHTDMIARVVWSPDGTRIASGGLDQTVRVWDSATGQPLETFDYPGLIVAIAWSPDGQHLAYGGTHNPDPDTLISIVDAPQIPVEAPAATPTRRANSQ